MNGLVGTGYLLRFMLRRDRVRLLVWIGSLAMFCVYFVVATAALYPTPGDRQNRAATMANPGGAFLSGPGYGLDDYSTGAMFANEMALYVVVFLAAMNILSIVRNTRAEEETGRAEIVGAMPVGRHAAGAAALLVVVIADAVFAVLGGVLLVGVGGLAVVDTLALMAGLMLTALVFAGVATVTCQVTVHARGASGLAFAALGVAVLLRGVGDIQQRHGSGLSWLSPIGWMQQMRPYVDLRPWPLVLTVLATVGALALGAHLADRRDLGGDLLPERAGRADATPALASPFALALRQQRTALLCWLVGLVTMLGLSGAFLGRDTAAALDAVAAQNSLAATIFGDDPFAAFLAILMLHCALAVAGFAIGAVLRVKAEEDEGRLGLALARPVSRTELLLSHVAVVVLGMLVLLFVGGALALWVGSLSSDGDVDPGVLFTSAAAFAPGIAVLVAVTAALHAWVPRATALAWVLFAVVLVESFFGELLNLPAAISGLSPFWWVGDHPRTPVEPSHLVGLGAAAAVLLAVAVVGFRRRDLVNG